MTFDFLDKIKAERIDIEDALTAPFFYQQQKAYSFCQKYINNKTTLEVGSGSGFGAYCLAKNAKKIVAIDKDFRSIERSKKNYKRKNLTFLPFTIENFQLKEDFEVIIILQVIEHIIDVNSFIKKLIPFLKKNGVLIISTPNSLTQSYNENPYHHKEFNHHELKNLLSNYFNKIDLYGVKGDKFVLEYELLRKRQVIHFLSKDKLNLRKFIPRSVKQFLFDIASFTRKSSTQNKNKITENNFKISKINLKNSIDLIAVCKQAY